MKRFTLSISLLEDLHTGSGTGAGDVDALLARDRLGRPVIRASHVMGVWAQALRDAGRDQDAEDLFGAPGGRRGALAMTSLYAAQYPVTITWSSTAREEGSRVPREDTLRTREFVAAGTRFDAVLWFPEEHKNALRFALARSDALGARRQRGDGLIGVTCFKEQAAPPVDCNAASGADSQVLRLLLRADDPICLPVTGVPGNIIASEVYIRGQQLAGAIAGALFRSGDLQGAALWLGDGASVSNALPLPEHSLEPFPGGEEWRAWRVLPVPLAYQRPKPGAPWDPKLPWWASATVSPNTASGVDIVDRLVDDKSGEKPKEKPKRPGDREFLFQTEPGGIWTLYDSSLVMRLRNAVPRDSEDVGALFSQEELPEKTLFLADIRFDDPADATACVATLAPLLTGERCLEVGRGGSPVSIVRAGWLAETSAPQVNEDSKCLDLLLCSDMIARTANLAFAESLDPSLLAELCGLPIGAVNEVKVETAVIDSVDINGFNAVTGLPKLPAIALRRGSSLRYSGPTESMLALRVALSARCGTGLGERTHEGYGRFLMDFRQQVPTDTIERSAIQVSQAGANHLEDDIAQAEQTWNAMAKLGSKLPRLTQWQKLRSAAALGDKALLNNLSRLVDETGGGNEPGGDDIRRKYRAAWLEKIEDQQSLAPWLYGKVNSWPAGRRSAIFRQLLRFIGLNQGDKENN